MVVLELTCMAVKLCHCYVKVTSSYNVASQHIQELLGAFFKHENAVFKAAYSVTFALFILEIMFLFFKNTVKILKFRYTFYLFRNN